MLMEEKVGVLTRLSWQDSQPVSQYRLKKKMEAKMTYVQETDKNQSLESRHDNISARNTNENNC